MYEDFSSRLKATNAFRIVDFPGRPTEKPQLCIKLKGPRRGPTQTKLYAISNSL